MQGCRRGVAAHVMTPVTVSPHIPPAGEPRFRRCIAKTNAASSIRLKSPPDHSLGDKIAAILVPPPTTAVSAPPIQAVAPSFKLRTIRPISVQRSHPLGFKPAVLRPDQASARTVTNRGANVPTVPTFNIVTPLRRVNFGVRLKGTGDSIGGTETVKMRDAEPVSSAQLGGDANDDAGDSAARR